MGASAFDDFLSIMMFQPAELSQFQSHYVAHDSLASAICRHHSYHVLHRLELRMDAGGSIPDLFALRVPASVGFKRWRREIEEEIGEEGENGEAVEL
jgi:hypothetical protein